MKEIPVLHTVEDWNDYKHKIPSPAYGVIVFKFSPKCPISRSIERKFDSWCRQLPDETPLLCAKIDVVHSRSLGHHIAQEFEIRHESPQALWITPDPHVFWHASHYSITPEALDAQLRKWMA